MRLRRSIAPAARRRLAVVAALAAAGLGLAAGAFLGGCNEGQPPTQVINEYGNPSDFLPPDGHSPVTTGQLKLIYRFDRNKFRLFEPISGTDPKFVKRDSVLALASAGTPGSPTSLLTRPDLSDTTLARVYNDPRLFGFAATDPAQADHFVEGRTVSNTQEFIPSQAGNWWEQIHNNREWTLRDSITAAGVALPAGGTGFVLHSTATARGDLGFLQYKPAQYSADLTASADGNGIYWHAWTLIAEREIPLEVRPDRQTDRQRNPRGLWLSIQSIPSFSGDPSLSPPQTIDQCLDGLPSHLDPLPLKFCGPEAQEGEIFSTWTYLVIDDADIHQRLNSEAQLPRGGRCGTSVVVGDDTLRMFPTNTFQLLARYEVQVERVLDQVVIQQGTSTVGRYPNTPETGAVIKFVVRMFLGSDNRTPAQFLELYYLRGIGEVVRTMGVNSPTRSNARLRSCTIAGTFYPPNNPRFFYSD
jgi:hypothetical protein